MKDELNKEALDALKYFWASGMIENCHGDQRYYLETLIYFTAEKLKIELA